MPAARIALAPITDKVMHSRFSRPGSECWGAKTTDGVWAFEREESPGTPWITVHLETRTVCGFHGTLRAARAAVAAGHAQADLERQQAHERGEHVAEREPCCIRC
jgi:hypothetical protein